MRIGRDPFAIIHDRDGSAEQLQSLAEIARDLGLIDLPLTTARRIRPIVSVSIPTARSLVQTSRAARSITIEGVNFGHKFTPSRGSRVHAETQANDFLGAPGRDHSVRRRHRDAAARRRRARLAHRAQSRQEIFERGSCLRQDGLSYEIVWRTGWRASHSEVALFREGGERPSPTSWYF